MNSVWNHFRKHWCELNKNTKKKRLWSCSHLFKMIHFKFELSLIHLSVKSYKSKYRENRQISGIKMCMLFVIREGSWSICSESNAYLVIAYRIPSRTDYKLVPIQQKRQLKCNHCGIYYYLMYLLSAVSCICQQHVTMYLTSTYNTVHILNYCIDIIECRLKISKYYKSQCIIKLWFLFHVVDTPFNIRYIALNSFLPQ